MPPAEITPLLNRVNKRYKSEATPVMVPGWT